MIMIMMITQCVIDDYVDAPALTSIVVDTT